MMLEALIAFKNKHGLKATLDVLQEFREKINADALSMDCARITVGIYLAGDRPFEEEHT
jgi:hypothetical protein